MEIFLTYPRAPKTLKDKIMFIKTLKELLGLGLKEAKDFTDNLEASGKGQFAFAADELPYNFRIALAKEDITWNNIDAKPAMMNILLTYPYAPKMLKEKIVFIKNFKELTNVGLKEAKDFTDNLEASGKGQFTIAANELPHHFRIALAKEDITWENIDVKPSAPQNDNTICLLKFSGDILQEMDLKSYLYKQFKFNYIEAAELIEQLKKGESINIDINPAEKDFISGVLERYGVAHHFGAPPAKTHTMEKANLNELAQKFKNMDADISLCLSSPNTNPDSTFSKLNLVKILRNYNAENWDLLASKLKAEEMFDKGKIIVKVHSSNFMAFAAEIKELKLHLETYSL